jgi:inhibitor of cysteine peptidase
MHRPRPRFAVLLALVGLLAFTAACSSDSDSSSGAKAKVYTQDDSKISVADGGEFVVALPANPSTGYSWSAGPNDLVTLEHTTQVSGGSMPGAEGTQRMTFRAEATGSTTLELAYARPFEGGVPPAETASFVVTVTK